MYKRIYVCVSAHLRVCVCGGICEYEYLSIYLSIAICVISVFGNFLFTNVSYVFFTPSEV